MNVEQPTSPAPDDPPAVGTDAADRPRGRLNTLGAAIGAGAGLLPHGLHHVGLLAGTTLIAGLGGSVLFAVLGLAAMLPLMIRLRRRFTTWWAPTTALAISTVMFSLSIFVIGPAVRSAITDPPDSGPAQPTPKTGDHTTPNHHP